MLVILGVLGFSNLSHGLPINDKLLHFFCFMLATGIFYFIFDIEEYVSVYLSECVNIQVTYHSIARVHAAMRGEYGSGGQRHSFSRDLCASSLEG